MTHNIEPGALLSMMLAGAVATATGGVPAANGPLPMSVLMWCFFGSFAGMGVAGPAGVREALSTLQGKAALALELTVFGVGGLASLLATSLLGFGVVGAIHVLGRQEVFGLAWAGKVSPTDLAPFGILISGILQFRAQLLMGKAAEVAVSLLAMLKRKRGEG